MPDPEAIPDLEHAILELLAQRDAGATICPSEAARAVAPDGWRPLMQPAREAASNLSESGVDWRWCRAGGAWIPPPREGRSG